MAKQVLVTWKLLCNINFCFQQLARSIPVFFKINQGCAKPMGEAHGAWVADAGRSSAPFTFGRWNSCHNFLQSR